MICPSCEVEFVNGITVCSDCKVELIDVLPKESKPKQSRPRALGVLLMVFGIVLAISGFRSGDWGGSGLYFLVAGAGFAASGILIFLGMLVGAYCYGATVVVMIVWSVIEVGSPEFTLLRTAIPALIAFYLFSSKVMPRLSKLREVSPRGNPSNSKSFD